MSVGIKPMLNRSAPGASEGESAQGWGLSASTLKIIACIIMTVDHVGAYILTDLLILRVIGRLAFPIFAYFIAEGCRYTRHKLKRFLLVFGFAILCEGVYLVYSGKLDGGILLTFSFSILLIYQVQALKRALAQRRWGAAVLWTMLLAASLVGVYGFSKYVLYVSYGFWGVLIPVFTALPDYKEGEAPRFFRYLSGRPQKLALCTLGMVLLCLSPGIAKIQIYCLFSVVLLALYNGKPGVKKMKYGFYVFYPLHLVVIFLLEKLIR